jgi:hypothetical protein
VLPEQEGRRRYRIKSLIEPHERVVSEIELSETYRSVSCLRGMCLFHFLMSGFVCFTDFGFDDAGSGASRPTRAPSHCSALPACGENPRKPRK